MSEVAARLELVVSGVSGVGITSLISAHSLAKVRPGPVYAELSGSSHLLSSHNSVNKKAGH